MVSKCRKKKYIYISQRITSHVFCHISYCHCHTPLDRQASTRKTATTEFGEEAVLIFILFLRGSDRVSDDHVKTRNISRASKYSVSRSVASQAVAYLLLLFAEQSVKRESLVQRDSIICIETIATSNQTARQLRTWHSMVYRNRSSIVSRQGNTRAFNLSLSMVSCTEVSEQSSR